MDWHELRRMAMYHGMKPNEYWASSFAEVLEFIYARAEALADVRRVTYDAMRISTAWIVTHLTTGNTIIDPQKIMKFKDEADQEQNELDEILKNYKNMDFSGADKVAKELGFLN